jgi:transcriptional regulator with XRE-family HTH domain
VSAAGGDGDRKRTHAEPVAAETLKRNRELQAEVYGDPLRKVLGRVGEQLGLTQARIASVLGLSPPMLSQLISGHRIKIGNPVAGQRLQALLALGAEVAAGRVPQTEVEARLADIGRRSGLATQTTTTGSTPSATGLARAMQNLFRAVAGAEELLDAAAMIQLKYPEIADLLRVYGAGRTSDAIAHLEANDHLL